LQIKSHKTEIEDQYPLARDGHMTIKKVSIIFSLRF